MVGAVKFGPQDLPPEGGYSPIQTERIKLRSIIGSRLGLAIFYTVSSAGFYLYFLNLRAIRKDEIEMRSSRLAVRPLLEAERDRAMLKHMRRIRDEETELMKDIPGWQVGKLYEEPVYFNERPELFEARLVDLAVFSNVTDFIKHYFTS